MILITDSQLAADLHEYHSQRAAFFFFEKFFRTKVDPGKLIAEHNYTRNRIAVRALELGLNELADTIINPTKYA